MDICLQIMSWAICYTISFIYLDDAMYIYTADHTIDDTTYIYTNRHRILIETILTSTSLSNIISNINNDKAPQMYPNVDNHVFYLYIYNIDPTRSPPTLMIHISLCLHHSIFSYLPIRT